MAELTNTTIPTALRDLLAAQQTKGVSIEALAEAALQRQIALAQQARSEGERLSDRYLVHPRLTSAFAGATVRVRNSTRAAVAELAQTMSDELARNVPLGRVLQALLWAELAPLTEADQPAPLPPTGNDRLNVNVARPLYDELLNRALRRTTRDIVATVDELLGRSLLALDDDPALCATLPATLDAHAARDSGVQTIRYGRSFEAAIMQVAQRQFGGIKSRAIAALLWYALEQPDELPGEPSQRLMRIDAALYARVVAVTNTEGSGGWSQAARVFIEQAVEDALSRLTPGSKKPAVPLCARKPLRG